MNPLQLQSCCLLGEHHTLQQTVKEVVMLKILIDDIPVLLYA